MEIFTKCKEYIPINWENRDDLVVHLESLPEYCSEYRVVKSLFSMSKVVTSIKRVENLPLYLSYQLKLGEYRSRGVGGQEMRLFHDTSEAKAKLIVQNNFDWRLANRCRFGRGVSFSNCPHYANKESNRFNGENRTMIVAKVLVGLKTPGWYSTFMPFTGDTTIGRNAVFVKYYDDEFYPEYLINYQNGESSRIGRINLNDVTNMFDGLFI